MTISMFVQYTTSAVTIIKVIAYRVHSSTPIAPRLASNIAFVVHSNGCCRCCILKEHNIVCRGA